MKFEIDVKSLLIGVLLTACVFTAMGAARPYLGPYLGRYRLVAIDSRLWPHVIDSQTGRIWRKTPGKQDFVEVDTSPITSAENNGK